MQLRLIRTVAASVCASMLSLTGHATQLHASFTHLSGEVWQVDYLITNDTLLKLEEFTIFFSAGAAQTLVVESSPLNWDVIAIQPDLAIPSDGFVDGLSQPGLQQNETLSGIRVTFTSLVANPATSQPFEIRDPATFDLIDTGFSTATTVPEPEAIFLWLSGLVALCGKRLSQKDWFSKATWSGWINARSQA